MHDIVIQIKQELKKRKLTYSEFSKMCGISRGGLKKIFSQEDVNPRIDTINSMLTALDLGRYEKTPQGTYLTRLEQDIMDKVTHCTEQQQMLVLAYVSGLRGNSGPIIEKNRER